MLSISNVNLRKLDTKNEISLIIETSGGYQQILSQSSEKPSEIEINGIKQDLILIGYTLNGPKDIVIIRWSSPLTSCKDMFFSLANVVEINLNNFDSSQITDIYQMFYSCSKLISIHLKNFNTRLIKNMDRIFGDCKSLISLDLSSFDTSQVTTMRGTFGGCISLETINLSSFNTSSVKEMDYLFYQAESLLLLDLSNFDVSLVTSFSHFCFDCKSLIFLNLISFVEANEYINTNDIISSDLTNLNYCIDEEKSPNIYNKIKILSSNKNCNNTCFSKNRKIIKEKKICIDDCKNDNIYKYEFNNICYDSIQKTEGIDSTLINEIKNIENATKIEKTEYFSDFEKPVLTERIEYIEVKETIGKTLINENKWENFSLEYFFIELSQNPQDLNNEDYSSLKDEIIKNIKQNLIKGNLDNLLINVTSGEKKDLIATDKNIIYQITTSENQKNNEYTNISTINLGACENTLKNIYGIDKNLSLLILKIDYYEDGLFIPIIGYEVYHPENKTQLDLNYCKDILIKLNIPASIDESKEFKHDPNSDYYNDGCYAYTTENGTDILIEDRRNEYIDNNLSKTYFS